MERSYWQNQGHDPLFPDLLWSRPEHRTHAGKLLIVGGNEHGFSAPAEAYSAALKAGAGAVRVVLPDKLHRTIGKLFPESEYAASTPSGSFASRSLAELLAAAQWADRVLLAGDFGSNSETIAMIENFTGKYSGKLVLANDALDHIPASLIERENTLFVLNFSRLQKLFQIIHSTVAITSKMDLISLVEALHQLTEGTKLQVITMHDEHIFVALEGQVSTTKDNNNSLAKLAATASVWWLQNDGKPFEALTTAIYDTGQL